MADKGGGSWSGLRSIHARQNLSGRPRHGKRHSKAVELFTVAAEQKNSFAAFALGKLYLAGDVALPKNSAAALKWLTSAAELGNQSAQYRLGKLLLQGEDVPKDIETAVHWLTAAADQGNQYAQYALGKLYLLGKEVQKDRASAIKWFQLAADQGNEYAQYFLDTWMTGWASRPWRPSFRCSIIWPTSSRNKTTAALRWYPGGGGPEAPAENQGEEDRSGA